MDLLVIDGETVRRLLSYEQCTALMKEAMIALSTGRTRQLLRQIIDLGEGSAFGVMPGALEEVFGAKLLSVSLRNALAGLQSHQGLVALFDPVAGAPVAILHAGEVTAIRTASASAAATQALARSDARRLSILGSGEQAHTHALALARTRSLADIRIWGRSAPKAGALAATIQAETGLPVEACVSVRDAVFQADIICTVSAADEPILQSDWVSDGAHVNIVGSSRDGPREVDDALVARGRLFADHREGVLRQGAEFRHAKAMGLVDDNHVLGEIGEVMAGLKPGRAAPGDVTLYKSLGSIVQDLASGWFIYNQARSRGVGQTVRF